MVGEMALVKRDELSVVLRAHMREGESGVPGDVL